MGKTDGYFRGGNSAIAAAILKQPTSMQASLAMTVKFKWGNERGLNLYIEHKPPIRLKSQNENQ